MTDRDESISGGIDSPRNPINFPVPATDGAGAGDDTDDTTTGGGAVAGDALLPTTIPQVVEESAGDEAGPGGRSAARPTT
jgi:hypothetical protein